MNSSAYAPVIGAEIFIEPGQTDAEIAGWFKQMRDLGLKVTRIRMFEDYMHKADGSWDFSLFDKAFIAAEKYGIDVYANLFPATSFSDVGGFKFPKSEENLRQIAHYIENLVNHFKDFPALYGWVPINEPGSGSLPDDDFTGKKFGEWKNSLPEESYSSRGYTHFDFAEQRFLLEYNNWFLQWLIAEIRLYDPVSPVHVNNHAIFQHAAEYDFPQWRRFLSSLGGSAHASWHFGYFSRKQYTVAISANSEILRSGAGNAIPWMMTELQGGNNTYSGFSPMCPTRFEIAQWLWTTIGAGSKGSIFWCFNPRSSGFEAGEWAMVDFQDQPSDRLLKASEIAGVILANEELFAQAVPFDSGIHVLYIRESMWVEEKLQMGGEIHEGRAIGGVMKSALAYFEALGEMGLHPSFREIGEFDFDRTDFSGQAIILAHQISIPSGYWHKLKNFAAHGGKLIVEGLSGYYDEHAYCILRDGFPFKELFGGEIREFKVSDRLFDLELENSGLVLQAHLWKGSIKISSGRTLGLSDGEVIACRNQFGAGEVLWIPSLAGLGARINGDYTALSSLLYKELADLLPVQPLFFKTIQPGVLMKTMNSGDSLIGILINKSADVRLIDLNLKNAFGRPDILYADKSGWALSSSNIEIHPEETLVLQWK